MAYSRRIGQQQKTVVQQWNNVGHHQKKVDRKRAADKKQDLQQDVDKRQDAGLQQGAVHKREVGQQKYACQKGSTHVPVFDRNRIR